MPVATAIGLSQFLRRMQTQRQMVAEPRTAPTDFGCESACTPLPPTCTITIYYYYSARKLTVNRCQSGRLSKHCSKGVHPVPKACDCLINTPVYGGSFTPPTYCVVMSGKKGGKQDITSPNVLKYLPTVTHYTRTVLENPSFTNNNIHIQALKSKV